MTRLICSLVVAVSFLAKDVGAEVRLTERPKTPLQSMSALECNFPALLRSMTFRKKPSDESLNPWPVDSVFNHRAGMRGWRMHWNVSLRNCSIVNAEKHRFIDVSGKKATAHRFDLIRFREDLMIDKKFTDVLVVVVLDSDWVPDAVGDRLFEVLQVDMLEGVTSFSIVFPKDTSYVVPTLELYIKPTMINGVDIPFGCDFCFEDR